MFVALLFVACSPLSAPAAAPSSSTPDHPTPSDAPPSADATIAPTPSAASTPITSPTIAYVAAAGSGVVWGYVANSRLFRSTDRGTTWEERTAPRIVNGNIAFVDAREGWALSAGSPETGCTGQSFEILHTTDGAATWQRAYAALADPGCKTDLAFVDAQRGYLTSSTRDGGSVIYRTRDGGRSWSSSAKLPDPPGAGPQSSYADRPGPVADFGSVLLVTVFTYSAGETTAHVYRSTDHGATWSYTSTAPVRGIPVVFITPSRWIQLVVVIGSSRETIDGGRTWHPLPTDYQDTTPVVPQVVFGDANIGYATARGFIQRTTDGGMHWTSLRTLGT